MQNKNQKIVKLSKLGEHNFFFEKILTLFWKYFFEAWGGGLEGGGWLVVLCGSLSSWDFNIDIGLYFRKILNWQF